MSRLTPHLALLALATIAGCLTPPPLVRRRDASLEDGARDALPAPFSVLSVTIRDARGATWPENGTPRLPTILIALSDDVTAVDGCALLSGSSDSDLLDDLAAAPLRDATTARQTAARVVADGATIVLTPDEPLAPGTRWTVAVPAWLARRDGSRLGAPFTRGIVVSADPSAGARATDGWPPDGAFGVPTAIPLVALRFDGDVENVAEAVLLRDAADQPVEGASERVECSDIGWPSGTCAAFRPVVPLARRSTHSVAVRAGTLDATGAPIEPGTIRFVTGDEEPLAPLHVVPSICPDDELGLDGACARVDDESVTLRIALSGPARVTWHAGSRIGSSVAPRGDVAIALDHLAASTPLTLAVVATDYAGGEAPLSFMLSTSAPLPTLSITEVRADPAGAEPRQEYVELENYGPDPIDLAGLYLSDSDSAGDALPSIVVASGARALLVTDDFDPDDRAGGGDATVPAGTMLIRVDHTLCSGGLSNSGEPVFLRDAMHHRISAAPATPPPIEGVCIVRTTTSTRSGEPGTFEYDPVGTCTPGR